MLNTASKWGVPLDVFMDAVLPYAVLDEKRDVDFRWRQRFATAFGPIVSNATTVMEAVEAVVAAIPSAQMGGVYALMNGAAGETFVPGPPVSWVSETSVRRVSGT